MGAVSQTLGARSEILKILGAMLLKAKPDTKEKITALMRASVAAALNEAQLTQQLRAKILDSTETDIKDLKESII